MWKAKFIVGRRGWLRPLIISIVSRSPKNGAEVMDEIEKMTWGYWRPSPGSVYPQLDGLVQEGILQKGEDGKYQVTQKGKDETMWPFAREMHSDPQSVEEMLNEIGGYATYFEDLTNYDKGRITPHRDKIKALAERLSRIAK